MADTTPIQIHTGAASPCLWFPADLVGGCDLFVSRGPQSPYAALKRFLWIFSAMLDLVVVGCFPS